MRLVDAAPQNFLNPLGFTVTSLRSHGYTERGEPAMLTIVTGAPTCWPEAAALAPTRWKRLTARLKRSIAKPVGR